GNVVASFFWKQLPVAKRPEIRLAAADDRIHQARLAAVIGCQCELPVSEERIQVAQISGRGSGFFAGIEALVDRAAHGEAVVSRGGWHKLPDAAGGNRGLRTLFPYGFDLRDPDQILRQPRLFELGSRSIEIGPTSLQSLLHRAAADPASGVVLDPVADRRVQIEFDVARYKTGPLAASTSRTVGTGRSRWESLSLTLISHSVTTSGSVIAVSAGGAIPGGASRATTTLHN